MDTPKAVIYVRVSTELQAEQGTSLATQELVCLRKAQEMGARVVDTIRDEGISGARYFTRDGIQKALNYIETGAANTLIVAKLDRAGRDVDDLRDIRKRVNKSGEMVFADGLNFANNAVGNFGFTIQAAVAQLERETIAERTAAGSRRRAEEGKQPCGSRAPYGYHVVQNADVIRGTHTAEQVGTYEVVEEQAQYVREIYAQLARGTSLRKITEGMNKQGITPNRGGKAWYASTLLDIIKNPVYAGRAAWRRGVCFTDERRVEQGFKTIKFRRPAVEGETVYIPAPPLVSEDVWNQCQQQLARNREQKSGNPTHRYMLSGIARCPLCGNKMNGKNNRLNAYYVCKVARQNGQCVTRYYPTDRLEALVVDFVEQAAATPNLLHTAAAAYDSAAKTGKDTDAERQKVQKEMDALRKREQAVVQAQIAGIAAGADVDAYRGAFANIAATRTQLQQQLDALTDNDVQEPAFSARTLAEKAMEILQDVHLVLNAPDLSAMVKNQLLSRIVGSVKPNEEGAEITLLPYSIPKRATVRTGVRVR